MVTCDYEVSVVFIKSFYSQLLLQRERERQGNGNQGRGLEREKEDMETCHGDMGRWLR